MRETWTIDVPDDAPIDFAFRHTCELQKVNPFDYLVACAQNKSRVEENPAAWMPWNYKEKLPLSPNP